MAITDFNKLKKIEVEDVTDQPTISRTVPLKITGGDDSTTGTGEIVLDWSNISSKADIGVYDENDNLLDYYFESFDDTAEEAVIWVFRDWVQDGSTQLQVAYGDGPQENQESLLYPVPSQKGGWHFYKYTNCFQKDNTTFLGWITTNGDIVAYSYNHDKKESVAKVLHEKFVDEGSEHANPTFTELPDGRIIAFYARNSDIFYKITDNAYDFSSWGSESSIGVSDADYPQCLVMPDSDDTLILYFRDDNGTNKVVSRVSSTDNGTTWSSKKEIVSGSDWLYPKIRRDGNKIHVLVTRNPDHVGDNSIYYFYYDNDSDTYHKSDGTEISDDSSLPMSLSDLELVYEDNGTGARAEDMRIDSNGDPVVTYVLFEGSDKKDHRYKYAYLDGSSWVEKEVLATIPLNRNGSENDWMYWGGIALDPDDTSVLYVSREISGVFEIQKAETSDGGDSWSFTDITSGSSEDQFRPRPVENSLSELSVVWMSGYLDLHTDWDAVIVSALGLDQDLVFGKESDLEVAFLFNESSGALIDVTGNGRNGTVNGPTQGETGVIGSAYSFNGDNDYIDCGDKNIFEPSIQPVSWSFWLKPNPHSTRGLENIVFSKTEGDNGYTIGIDDGSDGNDGEPIYYFRGGDNTGGEVSGLSYDEWHHLVINFDRNAGSNGELDMWVDGQRVIDTYTPTDSGTGTSNSPFYIGWDTSEPSNAGFDGMICDVRIHSSALSSNEISAIYSATKSSPDFFSQQAAGDVPTDPAVTTNSASDVDTESATLNGSLDSLGEESSVDVYFEWGETDSYGNTTSAQSKSSTGSFSDSITGLTTDTEYHFRAVVTDGTDEWYGDDKTFRADEPSEGNTFFMFPF